MAEKRQRKPASPARPSKPTNPLQVFALWQWGLLCIVAGPSASIFMGIMGPSGNTAEARGAALGRGLAAVVFIIVGIVLILVHSLRSKR